MYGIAAAVMVALDLALRGLLPRSEPEAPGLSYPALLRSIVGLLRDEPVLRQSCLFGAMSFGAYSAFWTTLAFHLAELAFGYTRGVVGLLGLVGIVGALAAPLAGRIADRRSPRWTIGTGLACVLLAFAVLFGAGGTVWGLVAGVIQRPLRAGTKPGRGRDRTNYSENQGSDVIGFIPTAPFRHDRDLDEATQMIASTNGEDARISAARSSTAIEPTIVMRMRSVE